MLLQSDLRIESATLSDPSCKDLCNLNYTEQPEATTECAGSLHFPRALFCWNEVGPRYEAEHPHELPDRANDQEAQETQQDPAVLLPSLLPEATYQRRPTSPRSRE